MLDMSKYAGVQNPQLYQEILDKERKRQRGGAPPHEPEYSTSSSSNWTRQQKQNAVELMGRTQSTNLYSDLYKGVHGDRQVYAPRPKQAREPQPGVYVDTSNGEVNFTEIFKGIGEAAIDYARTGEMKPYVIKAPEPAAQEEMQVQDEWSYEPAFINEDGTYQGPMDWLYPKEGSEVFSPKNQAIGFAIREDSIAADAYAQKGWGNEVIDMNTAKDYYDGLLTPEEIAALSPEEMEAIRTWCQMEETRRDMFEQLLNYGERGNYTWENLVTHMEKMTQVIKYDPAIFRESIYGTYKFLRGNAGFFLSPVEWSLGNTMESLANTCERAGMDEEAEWFRQQAINIKTEAGLEWLDDKMAEWLNIRKGSVQEGDKIEQFGRKTARAGATLLLNLSGAPSWVANLLGAADTAIQATASVYEETGDAKAASAYGNLMGALDFGIGSLLDALKLGKNSNNAITKHITDVLSGSVAGKALMVLLNIKSGAALNTLGYGIYRTIEYYVLGGEKPVSREEIADTFAKFLQIEFVYEIIVAIFGGYDSPESSKGGSASETEDADTRPGNTQAGGDAEQPKGMLPGTVDPEQAGNGQSAGRPSGTSDADAAPPWMSGGASGDDGLTPSQEKEFVDGFTGQGDVDTDSASHIPASGKGAGKTEAPFDDPPQSGYHGEKVPQGQETPAPPREGDTSDGASAIFGDAEAEDKRGYSSEVDYTPNGVGSSITTNTGEVLDTTPSKTHFTTSKNPGLNGEPNSSVDIVDSNGRLKTRRWYNENGQATRDVDFTNHGNSKLHPTVPHEHHFEYNPDGTFKFR